MYYYTFHLGDYNVATNHLSMTENYAYRLMLDMYYDTEKPLPLNVGVLARKIKMKENQAEIKQVLDEFFVKEADGYHNKRCDEDIKKYQDKAKRARNANDKRWSLKSESNKIPTKNQEPLTSNQEPLIKDKRLSPRKRLSELLDQSGVMPITNMNLVRDWFEHRNKKKAAVTNTVLDMIEKEAKIAGVTMLVALQASIEYNWVGFKAKWYLEKNKKDEPTVDEKYKQQEWRRSEAGIINKGIELGIARTQWETMKAYRARLIKIIEDRNE